MRSRVLASLIVLALCANLIIVAADGFDVGFELKLVYYLYNETAQLNSSAVAGGHNISIMIPVMHFGTGANNVTLEKPLNWTNGFNWYIDENGTIKVVTETATQITWSVDFLFNRSYLHFQVPPPYIVNRTEWYNASYYEKNFTVASPNHLVNVSASVQANSTYPFYWLYHELNGTMVDRTVEYGLAVSAGLANFSGFSTSNQSFSLVGDVSCTEQWICTGWSSVTCGTRTCTDQNHCGTTNSKPAETLDCGDDDDDSGGGGGGSAGGGFFFFSEEEPTGEDEEAQVVSYSVTPDFQDVILLRDEQDKGVITLDNQGNKEITFVISLEGIPDYLVVLDQNLVTLTPGEKFLLKVLFNAQEVGVFEGSIAIDTEYAKNYLKVSMIVIESKEDAQETLQEEQPLETTDSTKEGQETEDQKKSRIRDTSILIAILVVLIVAVIFHFSQLRKHYSS